jgi:Fe-Mn family superoxide dismutase
MKAVSRRKVLSALAASGAGAAIIGFTKNVKALTTEEQAPAVIQAARAFSGQHSPKPLPFDPAKLKGLSEKLVKSHWENNYGGAVKALNGLIR